jgi:hypothetical protein
MAPHWKFSDNQSYWELLLMTDAERKEIDTPRRRGNHAAAQKNPTDGEKRPTGAIWRALRQSPLVGVELDLTRDRGEGRRSDGAVTDPAN